MTVMNDLVQVLQGYLMSSASLKDCAEWLAGADWDDPALTDEEKEALGLFELLLTDIAEGLRPESEFRDEASAFVAARPDMAFIKQTHPKMSTSTAT